MAFDYYQGTNGLWVDANWQSGTEPVDADDCVVPSDITASIAGVDKKGIYLNYLEFARGYKGNIGASGDPLIITGVKIIHKGSGSLWLKDDSDISSDHTGWLIIDADNRVNAATLDGEEMTKISVRKGNVTLQSGLGSVKLTTQLDISFRDNPASDADVTVNCALLASTGLLNMMAGKCTTNAAVPIVNVIGGVLTHSNTNSSVITTAHIGGTGILKYNSTGTMVTCHILKGGTLDLLDNNLAKSVTTINLYPGGKLIYNPDSFTGTINDLGGTIIIGDVAQSGSPPV